MLQSLREHAQGWIAVVIASVLCIAFALWGIEYYIGGGNTNAAVAKVNGAEITAQQLDVAYKRLRNQMQFPAGSSPELNQALQKQLKDAALQDLVLQTVLFQAAEKQGYELTNAQIVKLIEQVPAFQIQGQFSPGLYQRFVREYFSSEQAFIQHLKQDSVVLQAKQGILSTAFALPKEINHALVLAHQLRDFDYVVIPAQRFLSTVKVADSDIQSYYQTHADEFMLPEQLNLQYVVLSNEKIAAKATVSKAELDQYFQDNPALKANDAAVRQQAEKTLHQQKVDQLLANASDQLANLTYTNPDSLKPAADALDLPIQTTGFFTRDGKKTGIVTNAKVLTAAFSDSVLKDRNNSDLVSLDDHTVVVLRVAEYKPANVQPLAAVRDNITQKLKQKAAENAAKVLGQKMQAAIKDSSLQQQAGANALSLVSKSQLGRDSKNIPADILNLAFSLSPAGSAARTPVNGATLANGDYVVLQLKKMQDGSVDSLSAQERSFQAKKVALTYGTWDYYLYANQNMRDAKIRFKNK